MGANSAIYIGHTEADAPPTNPEASLPIIKVYVVGIQFITAAIVAIRLENIKNFRRPIEFDKSPPVKDPINAPTDIAVDAIVISSILPSHPRVSDTGLMVILKQPI